MLTISQKRKYQFLMLVSFALFVFLLATEASDRWSESLDLYHQLREKQRQSLNPDQLGERYKQLVERKKILVSSLGNKRTQFEQSKTGVIEFLNASAKNNSLRLTSLVPVEGRSVGMLNEIGFKISVTAPFHRAAHLTNFIETGEVAVRLSKIDLIVARSGSSTLQVDIEGRAYVVPSLPSQ